MKIALIQAAPIYLDKKATTEKIVSLLGEAAGRGAELCVFPETFLPGYPIWVERTGGAAFNDPEQKSAYARYVDSAVYVSGPEIEAVAKAAAANGVFVYLGIVERAPTKGTVYCTLVAIHPEQGVVNVHRKLQPTHMERLIWGQGDGYGLRVLEWRGVGLGGLSCWENWMPLARYSLYAQGEQVHIGVWPGSAWLSRDITRFTAMEGRVFAAAAGGLLRDSDIPGDFSLKKRLREVQGEIYLTGGSCLFDPDGQALVEPREGEEEILCAELDPARVAEARQNFDPAGHYSRSDVFELNIDRRRLAPLKDKNMGGG